jgi:hypothetical protein
MMPERNRGSEKTSPGENESTMGRGQPKSLVFSFLDFKCMEKIGIKWPLWSRRGVIYKFELRKDGEESDKERLQITTEEDKQFMDAIDIHGDEYLMIPKIAPLIPSRTADDVREYLRLYRLAQKRRLKEEIKKQQRAEDPPAESSVEDEPHSSRDDLKYTVVSPPDTAPYTYHPCTSNGSLLRRQHRYVDSSSLGGLG